MKVVFSRHREGRGMEERRSAKERGKAEGGGGGSTKTAHRGQVQVNVIFL